VRAFPTDVVRVHAAWRRSIISVCQGATELSNALLEHFYGGRSGKPRRSDRARAPRLSLTRL
jgi:hypothetical protein